MGSRWRQENYLRYARMHFDLDSHDATCRFLAEREEVLKHKWIESEKAGSDIGFEKALLDWIVKHRSSWRERRMRETRPQRVPA